MNFGPLPPKTGPEFSLNLRIFCIFLHCRASHSHFRQQNSTKLCHTAGAKPW